MEKERKIVDNLNKSEEWFVEVYKRLKQLVGPAQLHKIDFKDYQQLYGVLPSAHDCEQLLKFTKNNPISSKSAA